MSDRFFLDTNIFVYLLAASPSSKKDRAAKLVDRAIGQSLADFGQNLSAFRACLSLARRGGQAGAATEGSGPVGRNLSFSSALN
jgi:predicted nucleic acid-binding protein